MEKKDKKTDDQIMDYIIDLYLEKHPRVEKYSIKLSSEGCDGAFYYPLSDELKEKVRDWEKYHEKDKYYTLQDYLEVEEGGPEIIEDWLAFDSPFGYDTVEGCDLNDTAKFTRIKLYVLDKEGKIKDSFYYRVMMDDAEFRQILKLNILRHYDVSVNMLTYLMPEFTAKMMQYAVNTLNQCVCEFTEPFLVEMDEINCILDNIMNPMKNELGLFESEDKEIRCFMMNYALVPSRIDLFAERIKRSSFEVTVGFWGNKLVVEQNKWICYEDESVVFPDYWKSYGLNLKANELCKHLELPSYDKLLEYLKEHYNTHSALLDFYEFVRANCPNVIIKESEAYYQP